jgi:hypothetical protein
VEQYPMGNAPGNRLLEQVHNGMKVRDSAGKDVGRVAEVYFGESSRAAEESGKGAVTPGAQGGDTPATSADRAAPANNMGLPETTMAGSFGKLPDVEQRRLERVGYIRTDGGIFGSDRYIAPDQVHSVTGDEVQLSVPVERLLKA